MKDLSLKGKKALWLWNKEMVTIRHVAWGKYFVTTKDGSLTRIEKDDLIIVNE
mgnify:CR=1 FL=1